MSAFTRRTLLTASAGAAALALSSCGLAGGKDEGPTEKDGVTTIVVGASPKPHAEILQFVQDELAQEAGLSLKITQYTDYQIPNQALNDGDPAGPHRHRRAVDRLAPRARRRPPRPHRLSPRLPTPPRKDHPS